MTDTKQKAREFWLDLSYANDEHNTRHSIYFFKSYPRHIDSEVVHVIEYTRVEELEAENARLRDEVEQLNRAVKIQNDDFGKYNEERDRLRWMIEEMKNYIIEINDQNNDRCWYNVERLCSEAIASTSARLEKVGGSMRTVVRDK